MKRYWVQVMLFIISIWGNVFGQHVQLRPIVPVSIQATMQATTSLIFPYPIITADWGSSGIIVEQVKVAKNILHIKAARVHFPSTNLSVVTGDGQFYAFNVTYDSMPAQLNFIVGKDRVAAPVMVTHNVSVLQQESQQVQSMRSFLHLSKKVLLTTLQLSGVYIGQHAMWLKLDLHNRSALNFPIGYVRFFIKDRRVTRRSVVQDKEMVPIFSEGARDIGGHHRQKMHFGFSSFTVAKNKRLVIQIGEKGEGRFIELNIPARKVLRAKKM